MAGKGPQAGQWAFACLLCAACNQVYDLKPTELVPDVNDSDHDTVIDIHDNCLEVANPTQSDDDGDGLGDACDNCPLVSNPEQDNVGDQDPIGDLCDPHPANDGDCLVMFDTFADSATFASGWAIAAGAAGVHPEASTVRLDASASAPVALYALDDSGTAITGAHSIQLAARLTLTESDAEVSVITVASTPTAGLRCGVVGTGSPPRPLITPANGTSLLSSLPFGDLISIRLVPELPSGMPALDCRIDYGIAIGVGGSTVVQAMQGNTGVFAEHSVVLEGIAVFRYLPGQSCPVPVLR